MVDLKRILGDCYWDSTLSTKDIESIARGEDRRAKAQLFEKILLNSSRPIADLPVFQPADLAELINSYTPAPFNYEHAARRKNIVEVFFLGKELTIQELQWQR